MKVYYSPNSDFANAYVHEMNNAFRQNRNDAFCELSTVKENDISYNAVITTVNGDISEIIIISKELYGEAGKSDKFI